MAYMQQNLNSGCTVNDRKTIKLLVFYSFRFTKWTKAYVEKKFACDQIVKTTLKKNYGGLK